MKKKHNVIIVGILIIGFILIIIGISSLFLTNNHKVDPYSNYLIKYQNNEYKTDEEKCNLFKYILTNKNYVTEGTYLGCEKKPIESNPVYIIFLRDIKSNNILRYLTVDKKTLETNEIFIGK